MIEARNPNGSFTEKTASDRNARQDDRIKYDIKYNYQDSMMIYGNGDYTPPETKTKIPDVPKTSNDANDVVIVTEYSTTDRPCPSGYTVTNSFNVDARADGQTQVVATCSKGNAKAQVVAGPDCPAGYDNPDYKYTTDSRSSIQMTSCVAPGSKVAIRFIGEYVAGDPKRGCPANYSSIYTSELVGNSTATCRQYL